MPEAIYRDTVTLSDFVTKDMFNVQVRSIRDQAEAGEKVSDARFDKLEALIAGGLKETDNKMKAMGARMDTMSARMDSLEKSMGRLTEELSEQKALAKETDNRIKALDARIDNVEKNMDRMEKSLDRLGDRTERLQNDMSDLKGGVRALAARLDTQQTKFGWYLTIFGLVITVVVAAIQFWK